MWAFVCRVGEPEQPVHCSRMRATSSRSGHAISVAGLVAHAAARLDVAEHRGVEMFGERCDRDVSHGLGERCEQAS